MRDLIHCALSKQAGIPGTSSPVGLAGVDALICALDRDPSPDERISHQVKSRGGVELSRVPLAIVPLPASATLLMPAGVAHLDPQEAVMLGMVRGWRLQQLSRLLSEATIDARLRMVERFRRFTGEYPWRWQPVDVEEFTSHLRSSGVVSHSALRAYQGAIALFCDYLVDLRYGWAQECIDRFGTHPVQVCHEWNTARHVSEFEGSPAVRPFTRRELQDFFDFCDEQVGRASRSGRKGWLTAYRDATLFKVVYGFGLRRREAAMLDVHDFRANAATPELGRYGICSVRWGKAMRGSPPRRRNVLSVFPWVSEVLEEYAGEVRPLYQPGDRVTLWPTERGSAVGARYVSQRFRRYADQMGLPPELHPHCLRHAYVTNLIEDGYDPFFVQQQVGHLWGSTTALYTGVSTDYKNTIVRRALDRAFAEPDGSAGRDALSDGPAGPRRSAAEEGVGDRAWPAGETFPDGKEPW